MSRVDRYPVLWLFLGVALLAATHFRFGIDALTWVAWVPFLRFLRLRPGVGPAFMVIVAGIVAFTLGVLKIVTPPLPMAIAVGFGVPIGLMLTVPAVAYGTLRPRLEHRMPALTALLFPALMGLGEWSQSTFTELGSWGAAAHTQLDNLALLQLASITGAAGVSFVIYLVNVAVERALWGQHRLLGASLGAVLAIQGVGGMRLASLETNTDVVRVAAVGTEATFGGAPLPDSAELAAINDGIERRVRQAAAQGAEIVVFNEGATLTLPNDRPAFEARWAALADELDIEMVAAWIVPVQLDPLQYENVSVTFRPDGTGTPPYLKHHPVPGEPAIPGTGPLPALDTASARVGTAICYDGDFPRLGLGHARNGVDLLAVPSSDWRGIDPIHTEMLRLRAIEGGYSVVRSTRLGLSAGIDAGGRFRGTQSAYDTGDKVLLVDVPRAQIATLYRWWGDGFIALCLLVVLVAALRGAGAWVPRTPWLTPSRPSAFAR